MCRITCQRKIEIAVKTFYSRALNKFLFTLLHTLYVSIRTHI